jgi:serine/threonine protein kinase
MDPGTALGVVSLVIQCLQAFQVFVDAAKFPEASRDLLSRLDIEHYKFKIWSKTWGISIERVKAEIQIHQFDLESGAELIDDNSPLLLFCAKNIRRIIDLLTKADDLKSLYGLKIEEAEPGELDHLREFKTSLIRRKTLEAFKRITWSIQDQTRIRALVANIRTSIEDLFTVLPPHVHWWDLDKTVAQGLVAKNRGNVGNLRTLGEESRRVAADLLEDGKRVQRSWQRQRRNVYLSIAGIAQLAMSRLSLQEAGGLEDKWQIRPWTGEFDEEIVSKSSTQNPRAVTIVKIGSHVQLPKNSEVLIEWRRNEDDVSPDMMLKRMYDIAQLLDQAIRKPRHFCLLDCVGFFTNGNKFILVFSIPSYLQNPSMPTTAISQHESTPLGLTMQTPSALPILNHRMEQTKVLSLLDLILEPKTTEIGSLTHRFHLARKIAQAITSMHACGWMHKGVKSKNTIFLGTQGFMQATLRGISSEGSPNIMESPYLSGFSYARPDENRAFSDAKDNENLYLHPQYLQHKQNRYRMSYDLYSLGLVLFEIARWAPIEKFWKQDQCSDLTQFGSLMLARAKKLGFCVGDTYRDVVVYCLSHVFEDEDSEQGRIQYVEEVNENVILKLQECKA